MTYIGIKRRTVKSVVIAKREKKVPKTKISGTYKKFDGKEFKLEYSSKSKTEAERYKKYAKDKGHLVRIEKSESYGIGIWYLVWIH